MTVQFGAFVEDIAKNARSLRDMDIADVLQEYPAYRIVGEQYIAIQRMMHGQGRLMIGYTKRPESYEQGYCYEDFASAFIALSSWDGVAEPQGWFRSLHDGRRRPDGDPALEYVHA